MTEADRPSSLKPSRAVPAAGDAGSIGRKMRCSINAKILTALLALSLLPLILCIGLLGFGMNDVRVRVKSELLTVAQANIVRLTQNQAAIADAMLDKVEAETRMVAYAARMLLSNPQASQPENGKPDKRAALAFLFAPGVDRGAVKPEVDMIGRLDDAFRMIRADDPTLDAVYYGSQSGVTLQYRGDAEAQEVDLWQIGTEGDYDPRQRPWYIAALWHQGEVWSKYANWGRGQRLFALDPAAVGTIGSKVSAALVRALADKQIQLEEGRSIFVVGTDEWQVQDKNGKHYVLRSEAGWLNVYSVDILTCSLAVAAPDGRPAGVVGLDINMEAISQRIIRTPVETPGYAFLLNEWGELIEQERADMFVPGVGSDLRRKMTAGETGIAFDAASVSWVAYAPIPSIQSANRNRKSYWSLGISMPETEITRLADEIQQTTRIVLQWLVVAFLAITALIVIAAFRMSKGITGPILALDEGARCIGAGNLDHRFEVKSGDEIEALADAFNKMADDLKTYIKNLEVTTAEKERFASELRVAHDIQMSFLKKIFPPFPDRDDLSLYATIEPAREVGGRFVRLLLPGRESSRLLRRRRVGQGRAGRSGDGHDHDAHEARQPATGHHAGPDTPGSECGPGGRQRECHVRDAVRRHPRCVQRRTELLQCRTQPAADPRRRRQLPLPDAARRTGAGRDARGDLHRRQRPSGTGRHDRDLHRRRYRGDEPRARLVFGGTLAANRGGPVRSRRRRNGGRHHRLRQGARGRRAAVGRHHGAGAGAPHAVMTTYSQ